MMDDRRSENTGGWRYSYGPGRMIFLLVIFAVLIGISVMYLKVKSEIALQSRTITGLQEEVNDRKEENNIRQSYLQDLVSLDEVRERAVNELGMVYGNPDQMTGKGDTQGDYLIQKEDIPEH